MSTKTRKLHLNINERIHQRLRVKCAYEDKTMQEFVSELIKRAVDNVPIKPAKKGHR